MRFDFDSETRRRLGYRLIDQIDSFFSSLPDRPVQLRWSSAAMDRFTMRFRRPAKMQKKC